MPTIAERIQAQQQAGQVPAAAAQARSAAQRAATYLANYQAGKADPDGAYGLFAVEVDKLLNGNTEELTELGAALQLCADLVSDLDTNHPWIMEL